MLKFFTLTAAIAAASLSLNAQTAPKWVWGKTDTSAAISMNPTYIKHVVATGNKSSLWGVLQNNGMLLTALYGNYAITEFDSSGRAGTSIRLNGNLSLIDAQADALGNWYILGQYYDTVRFPGGTVLSKGVADTTSSYFLCEMNRGTLGVGWVKVLGADNNNIATAMQVTSNGIYVAIDSEYTKVCRYDRATGRETLVFTQPFHSITSSIAIDDHGSIYLAGSCAFAGLNFGGHAITPATGYPAYLVRYKADGTHDWHYIMNDVTCVSRKISLATNNMLYYTGNVNDSFSIGTATFHHPAWVYGYMATQLDSTGTINWAWQLKDSLQGDAGVEYNEHATVMGDHSLSVLASIRSGINWADGVNTNFGLSARAAVVNYTLDGKVNWVKPVGGSYSSGQHIVADGATIYIAGNVSDTTSFAMDAVVLPAAHAGYTPIIARMDSRAATTAVENNIAQAGVHIYPNPASRILNISLAGQEASEVSVVISDIAGRTVYTDTWNVPSSSAHLTTDISNFANGIYIVRVKSASINFTSKVDIAR